MNVLGEAAAAMRLIWGVLRFDATAPQAFANTAEGARRSFAAAFLGLPLYLLVVRSSLLTMLPSPDFMAFLPPMLAFYVIEWLVWPNLMVGVSRWLGRERFYCRYVAAYNWFALTQMLLMLPYQFAVFTSSATLPFVALLGAVATVAFAAYEWFIARHALSINGRGAFAVVLINLLTGLVLMQAKAFFLGV